MTFYSCQKEKASIDIGDFIIDVDMNGFITGIKILNASQNLNLTEKQLESLQEASMVVTYKIPNYCAYLLSNEAKRERFNHSLNS